MSAFARASPIRCVTVQVPPESGIKPILQKAWINFADLEAITRSQAKAMFAPAPAATPLTAQITGFSNERIKRISGLYRRSIDAPKSGGSLFSTGSLSSRSCPAQKPRPAPVKSTTRHSWLAPAFSSADRSAMCNSGLRALSFSGRFSVNSRHPSMNSSFKTVCSISPGHSSSAFL